MLRVILIFWCLLLSFIYCFPLFASLPLVFCALKFVGLWSLIPRVFNASGYFILHSCLPTSDVFDYCTLTDLGASSMPSLFLTYFLIYFIFWFLHPHRTWRIFYTLTGLGGFLFCCTIGHFGLWFIPQSFLPCISIYNIGPVHCGRPIALKSFSLHWVFLLSPPDHLFLLWTSNIVLIL